MERELDNDYKRRCFNKLLISQQPVDQLNLFRLGQEETAVCLNLLYPKANYHEN